MGAMSDYLETALINHIFRGTAYTAPTTLGIALCTATLSDSDAGTLTGKEISGSNSYARVPVASNTTNWGATTGGNGTTTNSNSIVFPTATADWGTVTYVALCDSTTTQSGNILFYGALASSKLVQSGDTFQFNASQLSIAVDS